MKYFTDRWICDTLQEMRDCHKAHNYSYLSGLIEEAQSYANRMESGLHKNKDWARKRKELKKLERDIKQKKKELDNLTKEIEHQKGSNVII